MVHLGVWLGVLAQAESDECGISFDCGWQNRPTGDATWCDGRIDEHIFNSTNAETGCELR